MLDDDQHGNEWGELKGISFAIFRQRCDDLWAWMKGRSLSLDTLVAREKTFPDCVTLIDYDMTMMFSGKERLQTRLPPSVDLTEEAFPILEVLEQEELTLLGRSNFNGEGSEPAMPAPEG